MSFKPSARVSPGGRGSIGNGSSIGCPHAASTTRIEPRMGTRYHLRPPTVRFVRVMRRTSGLARPDMIEA